MSKELHKKISDQAKLIEDLLVVIDTAQTALRRAESTIKNKADREHVLNQSARWVLRFKYEQ